MCFLAMVLFAGAQAGDSYKSFKPIKTRELFHDYVDREQKAALRADGRADNFFKASNDEDINYHITKALTEKVDQLQYGIEKDSALLHGRKVAYLRGIEKMLKQFVASIRPRNFPASYWPSVLETYAAAIEKDKAGESIEEIIEGKGYEVANMVMLSGAFEGNTGFKNARYSVLRKYAHLHPDRIFFLLKDNTDVPFRDSLILVASYKYPNKLYDYAAANTKLGYAIRSINDSLVRAVTRMATSGGSGQMYFPFLDNILRGEQTFEDIDGVKNDDLKYFKLLVKTRMNYMERVRNKQKVYELEGLTRRLEKKAKEVIIKQINGLHERPDHIRFAILQQLTPQELYYVAVSSESEIYTSSYTRGVYPIMMQKIGNRGDSLLLSVGFDRFKKFIKMAAGFNTLNEFLKSFSNREDARSLMTAFVNGLEKSQGLEDGVDVADSYVSIYEGNKELAKSILELTRQNLEKNLAQNNQRGIVMYNLLYKLFLSADSTNNIDLSREFGIPPVYTVNYNTLAPDSQKVVMQVFFFGDEDGRMYFQNFLHQFPSGTWKRTDTKQWVVFTTTRGKPLMVFANKPLDEDSGEDEKAQDALSDYLRENGLEPTVIIHRGHSYYAASTIEHITPAAKIVFLGSCGGYHLIHDVLGHAPDAHIIASKQIGKGVINQPFFNILNEKLRNGQNIDWIPFWKEFERVAGRTEGFEDYIPPYKNLGAIFIKSYNMQMGVDAGAE